MPGEPRYRKSTAPSDSIESLFRNTDYLSKWSEYVNAAAFLQESSAPRADGHAIWDILRSRKPGSLPTRSDICTLRLRPIPLSQFFARRSKHAC
jgi:hypothetical protein